MFLSLVIPCYNEAENLPVLLPKCQAAVSAGIGEVILVDNGSTDASPDVLAALLPQHPGCRSIRVPQNLGYGHGILSGLRAASGDVLGWTHADLQTDPHDVVHGLELFRRYGPHIFAKGLRLGRPMTDRFFTAGMSAFETLLLHTPLRDINAQPTIFSRMFFESWNNPPPDFSLDLYAYYLARHQRLPVHRFPVNFGQRLHGKSSWNVDWHAKKRFIFRTIDYSMRLKQQLKARDC